jgi:carbonic anhydrase
MVLATPVEASPAQLQAFTSIFHDDYRPVQPLGARTITPGRASD